MRKTSALEYMTFGKHLQLLDGRDGSWLPEFRSNCRLSKYYIKGMQESQRSFRGYEVPSIGWAILQQLVYIAICDVKEAGYDSIFESNTKSASPAAGGH
jgi:hypothetical protein